MIAIGCVAPSSLMTVSASTATVAPPTAVLALADAFRSRSPAPRRTIYLSQIAVLTRDLLFQDVNRRGRKPNEERMKSPPLSTKFDEISLEE